MKLGMEARGIPGALANQPPLKPDLKQKAPGEQGAKGNIKSRSQSSVKNYEVSKKVETTVAQVGKITRIKAAIVAREKELVAEDGTTSFQKVKKETDEIASLVRQTIGFEDRGDSITVTSSPF